MKVHILSLSMLAVLFSFVGCSKSAPEIVEADYSYTLDKNVISVEMPEKFVHNPSNLVASTTEEVVIILNDKSLPEGETDYPFHVNVKLKRPLDAPLKVVFKPNAELMATYKAGLGDDYTALADGSIEGLEFSIPKGVSSFKADLKLKNAREILESGTSLCGVYSLSLVSEKDGVTISKHSDDLYLKIFSSVLVAKPNVSIVSGSIVPKNWNQMDYSKISAESNYRNDLIGLIVDGENGYFSSAWWGPSKGLTDTDTFIKLSFDEAKVSGFKVIQNRPPKTFKSFDVAVSLDGGKSLYPWGSISDSYSYNSALIVKFDEPELINTIMLTNLMSHKPGPDSYIDVYEIEIYTVD